MSLEDDHLRRQLLENRSQIGDIIWVDTPDRFRGFLQPAEGQPERREWLDSARVQMVPVDWGEFWTGWGEIPPAYDVNNGWECGLAYAWLLALEEAAMELDGGPFSSMAETFSIIGDERLAMHLRDEAHSRQEIHARSADGSTLRGESFASDVRNPNSHTVLTKVRDAIVLREWDLPPPPSHHYSTSSPPIR
jgi:hypothetical protein